MDKTTDIKVREFILEAGKQNPELVKAYLFGSYTRNTNFKFESDIDIALILNNLNDVDKFDMQVKLMMLALKFDSRIEPHPISEKDMNTNNPFTAEIKKTGIEIPL